MTTSRWGRALTRDSALASPLLSQIFEVADYIVLNDAAVNSYLETEADIGVYQTREPPLFNFAVQEPLDETASFSPTNLAFCAREP